MLSGNVTDLKWEMHMLPVQNIEDPTGQGRIQVRLPQDSHIQLLSDIDWIFPLLPKHIHITPQVKEYVFVFVYNNDRFYLGPIISQLNRLQGEKTQSAISQSKKGEIDVGENPENVPNSKGVYPQKNEVAFLGKNNSDIIHRENEVWIRAGQYISDYSDGLPKQTFSYSPTFLKLRKSPGQQNKLDESKKPKPVVYESTATIVADEINLISNAKDCKLPVLQGIDPQEMITDVRMNEIIEKAHQLPYGDVLCDFLQEFLDVFMSHTHNYNAMPTCKSEPVKNLAKHDLRKEILSNNIRIN